MQQFAPQAGSQFLLVTCPIFEALIEGPRGTGKTYAIFLDFGQDVGVGHGSAWQGILFRRTYPELGDAIRKSLEFFPRAFPGSTYNRAEHTWTFPAGEQFHFRHMRTEKDYWHYHGHEYPYQAFEELCTWPTLECWNVMRACARTSKVGVPIKRRATANPYGVGHQAVKLHFVDPARPGTIIKDERTGMQRVRIQAYAYENKKLLEASPDYYKLLGVDDNEMRRKAWIEGDWDIVAEGMFSDLWRRNIHVISPFIVPPTWRITRAFDWGYSKPFSIGWWAESNGEGGPKGRVFPRGTLTRIGEWYGWEKGKPNVGARLGARAIAKGIIEREKGLGIQKRTKPGPADTNIFHAVHAYDQSESIHDEMIKLKVRFLKADKKPGSRIIGWQRMRDRMLATLEQRLEEPGLYCVDRCNDGFLRTVPTLPRDEKNLDDVDTEAEDHAGDEARYKIMGPKRLAPREIKHRV